MPAADTEQLLCFRHDYRPCTTKILWTCQSTNAAVLHVQNHPDAWAAIPGDQQQGKAMVPTRATVLTTVPSREPGLPPTSLPICTVSEASRRTEGPIAWLWHADALFNAISRRGGSGRDGARVFDHHVSRGLRTMTRIACP